MGKGCVRFKKIEDVALDVVGETIRRLPVKLYLDRYRALDPRLQGAKKKAAGARPATKTKPAQKSLVRKIASKRA